MSSIGSMAFAAASAAARSRFGASNPDTRVDDLAAVNTIGNQRRRHCEIAGAAAEFIEAELRTLWEEWQAHFGQQLVFLQRRRHDAFEEISHENNALAAFAPGDE